MDDPGRQGELEPGVGGLHLGQHGGQEGPVVRGQPGVRLDPLRGVRERRQFRQVQVRRGGELVQSAQDLGDFGHAGVLVAVVGHGLPEGDHVPVDHDRLIDLHHTYGWVVRPIPATGRRLPSCGPDRRRRRAGISGR